MNAEDARERGSLGKALEIGMEKSVKSLSSYRLQIASKNLPDLKHENCLKVSR